MAALKYELCSQGRSPVASHTNTLFGTMDIKNFPITAYLNHLHDQQEGISIYIPVKNPDRSWEQRMKHLNIFKQRHGHCRVPLRYTANPKLGRWVMNVRSQFQLLQKDKKSSLLTEERLQQLREIDFEFAPQQKCSTEYFADLWAQHLEELYQFKQKTGHCRVPQRSKAHKRLASWVEYVRNQNRKLRNGQPNRMTPERIEQLNKLGFDFYPRKGRPCRADKHLSCA